MSHFAVINVHYYSNSNICNEFYFILFHLYVYVARIYHY